MKKTLLLTLLCATCGLAAKIDKPAAKPADDLPAIEAQIKETPADPMLHYRKSQLLFAAGQEQAAIDTAATALAKFKAAGDDLPWMLLGSITTNNVRVDVHYNMGRAERAGKRSGIVRPYSFRVWSTGAEQRLLRTLDFEIGYFGGTPLTAAIGTTLPGVHANYGDVPTNADFATVKARVLEIIGKDPDTAAP